MSKVKVIGTIAIVSVMILGVLSAIIYYVDKDATQTKQDYNNATDKTTKEKLNKKRIVYIDAKYVSIYIILVYILLFLLIAAYRLRGKGPSKWISFIAIIINIVGVLATNLFYIQALMDTETDSSKVVALQSKYKKAVISLAIIPVSLLAILGIVGHHEYNEVRGIK